MSQENRDAVLKRPRQWVTVDSDEGEQVSQTTRPSEAAERSSRHVDSEESSSSDSDDSSDAREKRSKRDKKEKRERKDKKDKKDKKHKHKHTKSKKSHRDDERRLAVDQVLLTSFYWEVSLTVVWLAERVRQVRLDQRRALPPEAEVSQTALPLHVRYLVP